MARVDLGVRGGARARAVPHGGRLHAGCRDGEGVVWSRWLLLLLRRGHFHLLCTLQGVPAMDVLNLVWEEEG